MKSDLKTRWCTGHGGQAINSLVRESRSGNGFQLLESPFGMYHERSDFRAIALPELVELRRVLITNADFSGATLNGAWIERCSFKNVCFDDVSFNKLSERGNLFEKCTFRRTKFKEGAFGYFGTRFIDCEFSSADFRRSVFVRPEFDKCLFDACVLRGVDFNAASFNVCEFRGELRDVWFRGGFPVASDSEKYGISRPNLMTEVKFVRARLFDVSFSDRCELSSVVLPDDGRHALFNNWRQRLESLRRSILTLPRLSQNDVELFCRTHLVHALKQDWYLLGLDDLIEEFGSETGSIIWKGLTVDFPVHLQPSAKAIIE